MRLALCLVLFAACTETASEQPVIDPTPSVFCGPAKRLVRDVCTELGADDGCAGVDDVCVSLCDGKTSCSHVADDLRPLNGWPVAPDGYCVVCLD